MKRESCESLQKQALNEKGDPKPWQRWERHAIHCEACAQRQKVWRSLQDMASQPVERLGDERMRAIRQALARRHRPKTRAWWLWSSVAAGALLLVVAVFFLRPKDPFSLDTSPSSWQQIAANPDWDLETNDQLRNRIRTMRQDFRLTKPQPANTIPATTQNLKNRLERLRDRLETEE